MDNQQICQIGIQKMKDQGYKLTAARQTVLEVLCECHEHLTSAEIWEQVQQRNPKIGRASIFRTLDLLTELSIIRPTYYESQTPHYIMLAGDGHHAHFICNQCEQVIELGECQIDPMLEAFAREHHLALTGHVLEVYGVCEHCVNAAEIGGQAGDSAETRSNSS
jgi:Fur family ferric uptake transcriptional regulator